MEEERIKSAFELAMERISSMPELTPEEIAAQKEKQYRPFGEAIAARYLKGLLKEDEIPIELEKHRGEQEQIVRRALISSLCGTIRLQEDPGMTRKALGGIGRLFPEKAARLEKAAQEFQEILEDFERDRRTRCSEFGSASMKKIETSGISGSAVKPNLNEDEAWQEELSKLRLACASRLESLRTSLQQEL